MSDEERDHYFSMLSVRYGMSFDLIARMDIEGSLKYYMDYWSSGHYFEIIDREAKLLTRRMREMYSKGQKLFSIQLSRWKNIDNREFLGIQLCSEKERKNCGLIEVSDDADNLEIYREVRVKLRQFGMSLREDIAACTTDSTISNKFDHVLNQLCYNEAIHLAFLGTFFKKLKGDEPFEEIYTEDDYGPMREDGNFRFEMRIRPDYVLHEKIKDLIRDLSTASEIVPGGKRVELRGRARWDTLIPEMEKVLELQECVMKASQDTDTGIEESKFSELRDIVSIWKWTKEVVTNLQEDSASLLSAEAKLKEFVAFLRGEGTSWRDTFLHELKGRIGQARNAGLVTLALFLENKELSESEDDVFPRSSKAEILKIGRFIGEYKIGVNMAKALEAYEATGEKSEAISALQRILKTIKPTAVECYKVVSMSGSHVNRIRSSEKSSVLNSLYFLKTSL